MPAPRAFTLGAAIDSHLKFRIFKGLFVPFKVLYAAERGRSIERYLRSPFLTPDNDQKLSAMYPLLTIKEWTNAFVAYLHIHCTHFPEQHEAMHTYMGMIRHLAVMPH